jgi:hypothetical protein
MTAHYRNIDLRVIKDFSWQRLKASAVIDVFNLENSDNPILQAEVTAPTQYWRIPLRFETPRSLQIGLRFRW